mgnify:CR=1 FL=1
MNSERFPRTVQHETKLRACPACADAAGHNLRSVHCGRPAASIQDALWRAESTLGRVSVVLIVVDQFRYDYLTRFSDLFSARGIGRLKREGASWVDANYDHVPTYTAPGHATLMTGAWPSETGIIANDWYDPASEKKITSVTDDDTLLLGGRPDQKGKSPRRLLCSTIGDELRLVSNDRSKVIGISAKDRSAILPAGRHANAAYWFSTDNGNMVSSNYYFNQVPQWVTNFNQSRLVDKWFGAHWDRLLSSEDQYLKRAGKDNVPWENQDKSSNDTNYFPHVVTGGADKRRQSLLSRSITRRSPTIY